jgi:hypothetical protein
MSIESDQWCVDLTTHVNTKDTATRMIRVLSLSVTRAEYSCLAKRVGHCGYVNAFCIADQNEIYLLRSPSAPSLSLQLVFRAMNALGNQVLAWVEEFDVLRKPPRRRFAP